MSLHAVHLVRRRSTQLALVFGLAIALVGSALAFTNSSTVNAAAMSTAGIGSGGASYCYGQLIVPQTNADTATIINQSTDLITQTIGVGAQPMTATYSGDGRLSFVGTYGGQSVDVIDTTDNSINRTLQVNQRVFGVESNFDGSVLWVYSYDGSVFHVTKIDTATGSTLATFVLLSNVLDLVLSPNESTLWVVEDAYPDTRIRELNASTLTLVSSTQIPIYPYQTAINASGSTLYMPDVNGSGVAAFDTQSLTTTMFGPAISYNGAALSPSGTTLYTVGSTGTYEMYSFDLSNNTWTVGIDLSTIAQITYLNNGMAITADGSKLYISNMNYGSGGLFVVETADISAASFIPTEIYARAATCPLAIDPAGSATTTTTAVTDPVVPAFTA